MSMEDPVTPPTDIGIWCHNLALQTHEAIYPWSKIITPPSHLVVEEEATSPAEVFVLSWEPLGDDDVFTLLSDDIITAGRSLGDEDGVVGTAPRSLGVVVAGWFGVVLGVLPDILTPLCLAGVVPPPPISPSSTRSTRLSDERGVGVWFVRVVAEPTRNPSLQRELWSCRRQTRTALSSEHDTMTPTSTGLHVTLVTSPGEEELVIYWWLVQDQCSCYLGSFQLSIWLNFRGCLWVN